MAELNTITAIKTEIQQRINDHRESLWHAEQDGNSDYDYYEGLIDAYECVLTMLNQLDKESI